MIAPAETSCEENAVPLAAGECRGKNVCRSQLPDWPTAVVIGTTIYRLGSIDPVAKSFYAELIAHMWWFEESLVGKKLDSYVVAVEPNEVTVPMIFYENSLSIETVGEPILERRNGYKPGVVHWEHRVRGLFYNSFALQTFPYDVQALTITLRINSKRDDCLQRYVVLNSGSFGLPSIKPDVMLAEWHIYQPCAEVGADSRGKPMQYKAHIPIRRRHEYFTLNVIGLMFIISTLAFSCFAVPAEDLADRSSIVLTLLLTAVAMKFAIADVLPKVPYATTFDCYMLSCFALLTALTIENVVIAIASEEEREDLESLFMYILACLWALFHAMFALTVSLYLRRVKASLGPLVNAQAVASLGVQAQKVSILPWRSMGSRPATTGPLPCTCPPGTAVGLHRRGCPLGERLAELHREHFGDNPRLAEDEEPGQVGMAGVKEDRGGMSRLKSPPQ